MSTNTDGFVIFSACFEAPARLARRDCIVLRRVDSNPSAGLLFILVARLRRAFGDGILATRVTNLPPLIISVKFYLINKPIAARSHLRN